MFFNFDKLQRDLINLTRVLLDFMTFKMKMPLFDSVKDFQLSSRAKHSNYFNIPRWVIVQDSNLPRCRFIQNCFDFQLNSLFYRKSRDCLKRVFGIHLAQGVKQSAFDFDGLFLKITVLVLIQ